jgi:hypothetical protein
MFARGHFFKYLIYNDFLFFVNLILMRPRRHYSKLIVGHIFHGKAWVRLVGCGKTKGRYGRILLKKSAGFRDLPPLRTVVRGFGSGVCPLLRRRPTILTTQVM